MVADGYNGGKCKLWLLPAGHDEWWSMMVDDVCL